MVLNTPAVSGMLYLSSKQASPTFPFPGKAYISPSRGKIVLAVMGGRGDLGSEVGSTGLRSGCSAAQTVEYRPPHQEESRGDGGNKPHGPTHLALRSGV